VSFSPSIGIEIGGFGQLALIAKIAGDVSLLEIGDVPYPGYKPMRTRAAKG
jgi:hypothetical protein